PARPRSRPSGPRDDGGPYRPGDRRRERARRGDRRAAARRRPRRDDSGYQRSGRRPGRRDRRGGAAPGRRRDRPVDVLINSAGIIGANKPLLETTAEEWRRVFDVNVLGTVNTMRTFVPGMCERGWGRVVNFAS